ncbi:MAG: hypothetical protein JXA33_25430 [Anaerolineae bacterium]|nr:hypothetical protein [Anaerolineae bacterium]
MEAYKSREKRKEVDLVGPIVLIGIGAILLLNNLGYLNWSIWDILWRFWPVFIIGWGLELLLGQRSPWGTLITAGLLILVFGGAIWYVQVNPATSGFGEEIEIREPLGDFDTANVTLSPAVGQLTLDALDDSDNFVEGTLYTGRSERIQHDFSENGEAHLTIKTESRAPFAGTGSGRVWDLSFHPDVALDLNVDSGVGDIELDLADLTLETVDVDFGVGQLVLKLPERGTYKVKVSGGVGSLVIEVPREMAARIETDAAIVGRNIPSDYRQRGDTYTSPDYDEDARNRANIEVDLGIGSITVKEK